jgi:hypothetical protein
VGQGPREDEGQEEGKGPPGRVMGHSLRLMDVCTTHM